MSNLSLFLKSVQGTLYTSNWNIASACERIVFLSGEFNLFLKVEMTQWFSRLVNLFRHS